MKINTGLTGLENLIAQILADNVGQSLTASQFTAGAPGVIDIGGRNTSIELTAVPGEGYAGAVTFNYIRLDLNSGVATPVTSVEVLAADDMATALGKVATAMGLVAADIDASAYTAPVDENTDGTITLTPQAGSLLYVGAPVVITLTAAAIADPEMGGTFATTDLNGFEAETVA